MILLFGIKIVIVFFVCLFGWLVVCIQKQSNGRYKWKKDRNLMCDVWVGANITITVMAFCFRFCCCCGGDGGYS